VAANGPRVPGECGGRAGAAGVRESAEAGTSPGISDLTSGERVKPSGMETLGLGSRKRLSQPSVVSGGDECEIRRHPVGHLEIDEQVP